MIPSIIKVHRVQRHCFEVFWGGKDDRGKDHSVVIIRPCPSISNGILILLAKHLVEDSCFEDKEYVWRCACERDFYPCNDALDAEAFSIGRTTVLKCVGRSVSHIGNWILFILRDPSCGPLSGQRPIKQRDPSYKTNPCSAFLASVKNTLSLSQSLSYRLFLSFKIKISSLLSFIWNKKEFFIHEIIKIIWNRINFRDSNIERLCTRNIETRFPNMSQNTPTSGISLTHKYTNHEMP